MNKNIEWFNNGKEEVEIEYLAIKNNVVICRIKREDSHFWVARGINGEYIDKSPYRNDLKELIEVKFND